MPPDTVDKDYVLGHFLAGFYHHFREQLVFKGGTCLRKCYFPDYRFSEDLDFTSRSSDFELTDQMLQAVCDSIQEHIGILFYNEGVRELIHEDQPKGYQVKLRYWGANHGKNQPPPEADRWLTKIKLEISTDEILVTEPAANQTINHPYSDELIQNNPIACYTIEEIIAEKLRSLAQRSYTAPRDFYDLYQLTNDFSNIDWQRILPVFQKKMDHKGLSQNPDELINDESLLQVRRVWDKSLAHQIPEAQQADKNMIIDSVAERIKQHLPAY